jgi:uncharacterized membrane protein HdeD (DUF308 family)
MIQTLTKNWRLLALCGVLEAIISVICFIMQDADGPLTFQARNGAVLFLGQLALAAGACTIAAGLWRSTKGKCWLLVLNGRMVSWLGRSLGFRWIKIEPGSHSDLLWLGSYFGFSAICMLGLALRLHL